MMDYKALYEKEKNRADLLDDMVRKSVEVYNSYEKDRQRMKQEIQELNHQIAAMGLEISTLEKMVKELRGDMTL